MQLTGPPRLDGIVRGYASAEGPIQDEWRDESTYLKGRVRTRRKGPARLWPSWSFRLTVTGSEWLAWRSDLEGDDTGEFDWTPRTRGANDDAWLLEHTYRARCVSDLPTLAELRRRDAATGRIVHVVDVEVEGVEPYAYRPDRILGGYRLVASLYDADGAPEGFTIEPFGQATATESDFLVSFLGRDFVLTAVALGPENVLSGRVLHEDDEVAVLNTVAPPTA